jgi:hypothetical protein
MFKSVKRKSHQLTQQWHDQFAVFKTKVKKLLNDYLPPLYKEIDETNLASRRIESGEQQSFTTRKMVAFWGIGLLFVAIGFLVFHALSYLYLVIAAAIISLALEGVITFWTRLTRNR